jgi:hypothetical protein
MAQFIRHVGKIGDRKVAVVFRQIPGEDHMCLVIYTELLNQNIHDPLISAIESPVGQQSKDLADTLNRSYTRDGKIILQVLHAEGMMKKVQTNQVMMTPHPNQAIRLSELNEILNEMDRGEEAVKRLQEMDASRGLQDPKDIARRMRGESTLDPLIYPPSQGVSSVDGIIGDNKLAQDRLQQSQRMAAEAKSLLAESERLQSEAFQLDPSLAPKPAKPAKAKTAKAKTTAQVVAAHVAVPKKTAGRPKKTAVVG